MYDGIMALTAWKHNKYDTFIFYTPLISAAVYYFTKTQCEWGSAL